ncbi:hypothetical protein LTR10_019454 [Elasticomyces elasticus]|uniref:Major facilitator superfamily (MFS) profile domain-containing protein n=1 Tax=Exophiala sideris TaxID=1016849 RepID=A0ABR0J236_9EURO|nr:hypothetical protein LTR10_019454 [Elasticomyces elasticus]KAK5024068.1 hypothetical protein LTS07_008802 [Exophiala sideris]KAK5029070.1 hypothetical protein LTR13_008941 [Exophiala sideris]KAK5054780.1 hypothetical protein LTR69_008687 [Exophiala sideris]KAK5178893.1 hypothetical protein LTR44_008722 [Eurotiomycetes sp. CCFEE 6388]
MIPANIHEGQHEVDLIPGTVLIADVDGDRFLLPLPADDPTDPLNWSKLWKFSTYACLSVYVFWMAAAALSQAPLFPVFAKLWNLDDSQVSLINGATVLVLGYGNFIVIPMSNTLGRRSALLVFGLIYIAACVWEGTAKSYGSFIGARSLVGLAGSPCETLNFQIVTDMFFLHERGSWVGASVAIGFLGVFTGPIIAGAMGENYGWQSLFWLSLGFMGVTVVAICFLCPETKFNRTAAALSESNPATESEEVDDTFPKALEADHHLEQVPVVHRHLGKGRPCKRQFLPMQQPDPQWRSFLVRDFFSPLRIVFYPIVLWGALTMTTAANLVLYYNLTESELLSAYGWSPAKVGYSNFALVVGSVIGCSTAGPFSDWVMTRATARNNGVREAEMRLVALAPFAIIATIGVAITGVALTKGTSWPWGVLVVIGYGSAGLCLASLPTIGLAYAVDCYKPITGELMVVTTVLKNTTGFSMSYWVPYLAKKDGFLTPLMVWYTFTAVVMLLAIPLYFWGKSLRRITRNSPVHRFEEH